MYNRDDINSILAYAKLLKGKTFITVLIDQKFDELTENSHIKKYGNPNRKGGLGNFLEEIYFGYKANSDSRADFHEVGLELKVSPYELTKKQTYRAGERLVLTMIDYSSSVEHNLFESHLWDKIGKILLIYYFRNPEIIRNIDYTIDYISLFTPSDADLKIIEDDYNKIISKIESGNAHNLTESDTLYLSACTKGASAKKSLRSQYYNPNVPAKSRAFAFKQSYMTVVLNNLIYQSNQDDDEIIIKEHLELENKSFENLILDKFSEHYGKSDKYLCDLFNREYNNNKSQWFDLTYRMLGIKSNKASEFVKANIVVKTIRIEENNKIKESISFPNFKFKELINEDWENASIHNYFEETKFLFAVFKKVDGNYIFSNAKFWNMPTHDLENEVRDCWQKTINIINDDVKFDKKNNKITNNLPSKKDNRIMHVRPHATKSAYKFSDGTVTGNIIRDANELPDGRFMTNQCFWLNNSYILDEILKD